jgi:4-hydroxybenzoate polyprenyltransferase
MRAYLQLMRLPNVFTAMADIALGFLFTHERLAPLWQFALLLATSSLLYLAGMVLNDFFDQEQDARERPLRPLPSGRISPATAKRLGLGLLASGTALGWGTSAASGDVRSGVVATLLAAAVLAYDGWLKKTLVGPVVMGACRTLNVLLGMSLADGGWHAVHWVVALGIGLYIVGVTVFARSEARASGKTQLLLGTLILAGGIALVASLPAWASGGEWPPIEAPPRWYVFWGLIGLLIAGRCLRAVLEPSPPLVQAAVRSCIFSLVVLDAGACTAVQDMTSAAAILLLLAPTLLLGRWIYST